MEDLQSAKIEEVLYRILEGKTEYDGFITRDPTFSVRSAGKKVYHSVLSACLSDKACLSDRDVYMLLLGLKEWTQKQEDELKKMQRVIENNKLDYYNDFYIPERKRERKLVLDSNMKRFGDMLATRHKYDNLLPTGIANGAMWHEMIVRMHDGPKKLLALADYHNRSISEALLRDIALSNEWMGYSSISKNPLGKPPIRMTDYQKKLYSWTNVYRNVRSHPECPAEPLIGDHDAFDGWLIDQNRKDRAEKSTKVQLKGIKPHAQNVYIMTKSDEGADDIMSLNDAKARAKLDALYSKIDETAKQ